MAKEINKDNINYVLKEYRVKLDKIQKVMSALTPSREISISITSIQNGKMWLGKTLEYLGQDNPYPNSKDASNTKIEPTSDVWIGDLERELNGIAHIQKVKQLRKELTDIYEEIKSIKDIDFETLTFHTIVNSWNYIVESNMWLGMELGRIRDSQ